MIKILIELIKKLLKETQLSIKEKGSITKKVKRQKLNTHYVLIVDAKKYLLNKKYFLSKIKNTYKTTLD